MNGTIAGFGDELQKIGAGRSFPLSRALTAPLSLLETGRGLLTGGSIGHAAGGPVGAALGGAAGAVGGLMNGVGRSLGRRRNFAQSTLARLVRGGKGMMEHEKSRLAEGLGLSRERLETLITRMKVRRPERHLGTHEDVYSRFANSKINPIAALERVIDARALAGRLAKGEPLLQHEEELVNALRARERTEKLRDMLGPAAKALGGIGAAGGAGYGGYRAWRAVKDGGQPAG